MGPASVGVRGVGWYEAACLLLPPLDAVVVAAHGVLCVLCFACVDGWVVRVWVGG